MATVLVVLLLLPTLLPTAFETVEVPLFDFSELEPATTDTDLAFEEAASSTAVAVEEATLPTFCEDEPAEPAFALPVQADPFD